MTERTLNCRPSLDPRNKDFPVRPRLAAVPRKDKLWQGPSLRIDQGREGACVGFGWAIEMMSTPIRVHPPGAFQRSLPIDDGNAFGMHIYQKAKFVDAWPGENYDGTSVLAGARVAKSAGYVMEYRWAYNVADVIDAVIQEGPVVLGIPWYESMYETNADGKVRVAGPVVGGHCITVTGYLKTWKRQGETLRWRGPSKR